MAGQYSSLSLRNIQGQYFWALEETEEASWTTDVSDYYTTDQPYEIYKWLGGAPAMTEWRGERVRSTLGDYDLSVVSDKFQSTLSFDVDDMRRDKTGQILRRVAEMGQKAATLPQRLFTTLIESNPQSYDGANNFFADSHAVGTVDNNLTFNASDHTNVTSAEMSDAMLEAIQAIVGFKDENGDPCNEFASSFLVMVPTALMSVLTAALKDVFTSAGVSNTLIAAQGMGMTIKPVVNPRLTSDVKFYTFRTDAPVKAGIFQEEALETGESFKSLGMDSDNAFWRDEVSFGAKRIAQSALGRYELATLTTFN
tara:strand:- start:1071 stop:2003 length:933 start_codon:yes stop_codon:yes gene_type:complete